MGGGDDVRREASSGGSRLAEATGGSEVGETSGRQGAKSCMKKCRLGSAKQRSSGCSCGSGRRDDMRNSVSEEVSYKDMGADRVGESGPLC